MWPFNKKQPVVAPEPTEADLRREKLFNSDTLLELLNRAKEGKQLTIWAYDDLDIQNGYVTLFGGKGIFKGTLEEVNMEINIQHGTQIFTINDLYSFNLQEFKKHNKHNKQFVFECDNLFYLADLGSFIVFCQSTHIYGPIIEFRAYAISKEEMLELKKASKIKELKSLVEGLSTEEIKNALNIN